jgi:hypothetical protein
MARFLEMNRPKSAGNLAELFCDLGRMLRRRVHLGAGTKKDEARPAEANIEAFTPYQPPWFAGAAWGTLLCAAWQSGE